MRRKFFDPKQHNWIEKRISPLLPQRHLSFSLSLFMLFLLVLFIYPAHGSLIPKEILSKLKKQPSFETLLKDPDLYKGQLILLGGMILSNDPLEDRTELLVEQRELSHSGKPKSSSHNKKSFYVISKDFLDPEIYTQGRLVTAYGTIKISRRSEKKKIYLEARSVYLWPQFSPPAGGYIGIGPGFFF
ncbi:Slp family lipoprotein [Methylacidiphilum caldifontis]|uniref:Slp family lipoprotein n=1 Tax=Methylacidiphilum caldifontis TaxID=2795386 RepID=UPI001A8EB1A2|nr:Slp family lipoprotein [Methylacidiphilum caldifontis]QSR89226.1 Slp family lipoprotein [Methylacidiphilum caldifontis]